MGGSLSNQYRQYESLLRNDGLGLNILKGSFDNHPQNILRKSPLRTCNRCLINVLLRIQQYRRGELSYSEVMPCGDINLGLCSSQTIQNQTRILEVLSSSNRFTRRQNHSVRGCRDAPLLQPSAFRYEGNSLREILTARCFVESMRIVGS